MVIGEPHSLQWISPYKVLQFDTNDSALCGPNGTLSNILELICNEPVEFNFHGLNGDVREWLTGSDNVL